MVQPHKTRDAGLRRRERRSAGKPLGLRLVGEERVVALGSASSFSVGSAADNRFVVHDPFVSKYHFRLLCRDDDTLWIHDDGSRNGTWVNDVRVQQCEAQEGAKIAIGRSRLVLVGLTEPRQTWGIVGVSAAIREVFAQIEAFGPTPYPVLITGETGTGKELVARALHLASPAASGPFEAVNCAAIPRELAESELFGHEKGAFTGASRARAGAFSRANGGTLFLDEIGEMPLELQPKLLRVLEQRQVQPIGGAVPTPVTGRIVAATHRDLEHEAARGRFRYDLLHRLAVCLLRIPPLRTRPDDVAPLAEHFIDRLREQGRPVTLAEGVLPLLEQHDWSGNVRMLQSAIHRAASSGRKVLTRVDFSFLADRLAERAPDAGYLRVRGRTFDEIRREIYTRALAEHGGNRAAAAAALGVAKSTFYDQVRAMRLLVDADADDDVAA